jgi:hypothetical protein
MTRTTIVRLFIAGLIAFGAAVVLLLVVAGLAVFGSVFASPDVVDVRPGPLFGAAIGVAIPAMLLVAAALVLHFVAWIGALIDTSGRPDKGVFVAILVLGVLGMLLIADLVYLVAERPAPPEVTTGDRRAMRAA